MSVQKTESPAIRKAKKKSVKVNKPIGAILKAAGVPVNEIASTLGVSKSSITHQLERFVKETEQGEAITQTYDKLRIPLLKRSEAKMQLLSDMAAEALLKEGVESMPLKARCMLVRDVPRSLEVLHNIERLESGKSTSNVSYRDTILERLELYRELLALESQSIQQLSPTTTSMLQLPENIGNNGVHDRSAGETGQSEPSPDPEPDPGGEGGGFGPK